MNCPSRTDNLDGREDWNQNPNALSGTTRQDFNGKTNDRLLRRSDNDGPIELSGVEVDPKSANKPELCKTPSATIKIARTLTGQSQTVPEQYAVSSAAGAPCGSEGDGNFLQKARNVLVTFGKFMGPGFMISVAYIDPGNYSTDVAAGASYRFKLLFVVLMSNIIAIFLQSLCIKLGTVSGMDLAQMCRAHLPRWLNIFLYLMAEAAIIATDIAEVIGTAIAINLLIPQIPLVAGCALSIADTLLILVFYRPNGSMKGLRAFEFFVAALVLGVVVCFIIQLTLIQDTSAGEVFKGYLPSSELVQAEGLYQACGILGATVMPHSLYLGSGLVQPRLLDYDTQNGHHVPTNTSETERTSMEASTKHYVPSLPAINFCMKYSIVELSLSLFTFALFVNSAILIVAGAALYGVEGDTADLFSIYHLLASSIAPAAGTIFALALLLSGISAGIVCTIAGQMVSEGALNWSTSPWLRRLITRSISITPSIIVAGSVGAGGLSAALNGTQVALSIVLPFVSAPIIYFTARNKFMTVRNSRSMSIHDGDDDVSAPATATSDGAERSSIRNLEVEGGEIKMRNAWWVTVLAIAVWLVIAIMNIANLVLLGLGVS